MKKLAMITVLMVLMSGIVMAAVTVRAGIFSAGAQTINVMARPVGGALNSTISSIAIPIAWETASGITITNVNYAPGLVQTDVGTSGIYSYAVYNLMPNTPVTWADGSDNVILTLTISGTGPAIVMLNDVSGVGWYFETGAGDLTDYASPFYVNSTELPLPVTLTSFSGKIAQGGEGVVLEWATASEVNNYGYTVQRKTDAEAAFTDVADAFIAGHGTTIEPQTYKYTDKSVRVAGKYEYRLKQQDLNGVVQYSQSVVVNVAVTDVPETAPREFALMQNYPNPFNPTTTVKFSVPSTGQASLKVYNMVGQEVVTLFEGVADAGRYYAVPFNATNLASGVYFYRLVTEHKTDVRRMMLLK